MILIACFTRETSSDCCRAISEADLDALNYVRCRDVLCRKLITPDRKLNLALFELIN